MLSVWIWWILLITVITCISCAEKALLCGELTFKKEDFSPDICYGVKASLTAFIN